MKFKYSRITNKEVIRRILNAYLSGDDTFIHCCQTFIKQRIYDDCFADFGLTTQEVLMLSEMKKSVLNKIQEHC